MKNNKNSFDEFIRLDSWLCAVRIFKTRSIAKENCLKGSVKINGQKAKPSFKMRKNICVEVKKNQIWRTFQVLKLQEKRLSATLASECLKDITDPHFLDSQKKNLEIKISHRPKGLGRPTKKDRRHVNKIKAAFSEFSDFRKS